MRKPYSNSLSILAIAAVVTSCGGGGDSGDPPTEPTPVAASITMTVTGSSPMTSIGDTRTATIAVKDANGAAIANAPVTFTTSNAAVATATGNATSATITAAGNGTATITATSGSVNTQVEVIVEQRLATVTLTTVPVVMGASSTLQPVARDARNAAIVNPGTFAITSASPSILFINATGVATGIAPGVANVTASITRDGVTANVTTGVSVTLPSPATATATVTATAGSTFEPPGATIERGGTVNFVFQSVTHNVQFQGTGSPANITESTNTTVGRSFPTVGTFPFTCTLHGGMNGTVTVISSGFAATLNGANERPNPVTTNATGATWLHRSGESVNVVVTFQGLSGPPVGAHLHGPAGANAVADILVDFSTAGQTSNVGALVLTFGAASIRGVGGNPPMSLDALIALINAGNVYVNVHTAANPGGEIRGQLAPL